MAKLLPTDPSSDHKARPRPAYPDPFIVPPSSGTHKQTFLLVHGGGQHGQEFGDELLKASIPEFSSLPAAFPDAKFIFPTATEQESMGLGFVNRQWFDKGCNKSDVDDPDYLLIDGLHDSVKYIHNLLNSAIAEVGPDNVVLGGLSQGCAVSLLSVLLWEGPPFAAVFGIAGWVPFRKRIEESWVTASSGDINAKDIKLPIAISCLRDTLKLPANVEKLKPTCLEIPIFVGHGVLDDGLLLSLARPTHNLLLTMGLKVQLQDYEELGHWWSGDMLRDFILLLHSHSQFSK